MSRSVTALALGLIVVCASATAEARAVHYRSQHPLPRKIGRGFCYINVPHVHDFGPAQFQLFDDLDARTQRLLALVEIEDSGVGLADCERVFEPFFTTKESGMGMGLAICRSIVKGHNGELWAGRNEKFGTTFRFTLPLHTNEVRELQRP